MEVMWWEEGEQTEYAPTNQVKFWLRIGLPNTIFGDLPHTYACIITCYQQPSVVKGIKHKVHNRSHILQGGQGISVETTSFA